MSVSELAKSIIESPTLRLNEEARLLRERFESSGRQVESLAFPDYATPIGQRKYDHEPIGSDIEKVKVAQ